MYQYARGALVAASCTTTRCGLPCSNSSSQLLGYGLGLGYSARLVTGASATTVRATTIRARKRRIGESLRVGNNGAPGLPLAVSRNKPQADTRIFAPAVGNEYSQNAWGTCQI